jgi:hypothetical protein
MKCIRCVERNKTHKNNPIRMVPLTGRAAENGLCCKCDREINGTQREEERGEKERRIAERRRAYKEASRQT